MRFLIFIFSCFTVTFINNASAQEKAIRIKYSLEFKIDSTDMGNVDSEIMYLDILPKSRFHFQPESLFMKDSILGSQNPQTLFGIGKPKHKYHVLKNYKDNAMEIYHDYTAFKLTLKEDVKLDWTFTSDSTRTILGQHSKLATTRFRGRNYSAWYSSEIPISDGSYKFKELPGLILEIYDDKDHYHFKAFSLQTMTDYKDRLAVKDYTVISKPEFKDFQRRIKERPSLILYNPGIQIPKEGLDKYDRTQRERGKYKNNSIELSED